MGGAVSKHTSNNTAQKYAAVTIVAGLDDNNQCNCKLKQPVDSRLEECSTSDEKSYRDSAQGTCNNERSMAESKASTTRTCGIAAEVVLDIKSGLIYNYDSDPYNSKKMDTEVGNLQYGNVYAQHQCERNLLFEYGDNVKETIDDSNSHNNIEVDDEADNRHYPLSAHRKTDLDCDDCDNSNSISNNSIHDEEEQDQQDEDDNENDYKHLNDNNSEDEDEEHSDSDQDNEDRQDQEQLTELFAYSAMSLGIDNDELLFNMLYFNQVQQQQHHLSGNVKRNDEHLGENEEHEEGGIAEEDGGINNATVAPGPGIRTSHSVSAWRQMLNSTVEETIAAHSTNNT